MNKCVAIIPARGGSKRIPGKNTRMFLGKPIIAYAIDAAVQSGLFDYIMTSTDSEEIAEISKKHGGEVPFYRSAVTSGDYAGTAEVILEVISELKNIGKEFDFVCCIYPTAPLMKPEYLRLGMQKLQNGGYATVFPVCPFSAPVYRGLEVSDHGKVKMIWPENLDKRSQDLPKVFHDAGQFYWINVEKFLIEKKLFSSNSGAIILNELEVQDIDNETDWRMAELKYKLLHEKD